MKQYPPIPAVGDESVPELSGHLWLLEDVEGSLLRFQLQEAGQIQFGGEHRTYGDIDDVPDPCRRAARHIRERLDREALRSAVDDVSTLTFFGRATHREWIDYDWDRLPPFLGFDVWSATSGDFRPPDAVDGIFDRLGLESGPVIEREKHSRDFDAESYTVPESAWYDGPAAGVLIRDKRGNRVRLRNSDIPDASASEEAADAEALADAVATDHRFDHVAARLRDREWELTVDLLRERVLDDIYREEHGRLFDSRQAIDRRAFRAAVAARAQRYLSE